MSPFVSETSVSFEFDSISEAVQSFGNILSLAWLKWVAKRGVVAARGEFLVVVDNEDRENEGDLIIAAELLTPEKMAFMIRHTSGVICIALTPERLDQLELPLMVPENTDTFKTAFTVSVDLNEAGMTTGISASDRCRTMRALADASIDRAKFNRPGHVFPLRYTKGGVLKRPGHTEASVDLCLLAGLAPAGVLCELTNEDGTMSRRDQCSQFALQHGLRMISIADLQVYLSSTSNKHGQI